MENITCSVCNESFSSRYSVRRHKTRKHPDIIQGAQDPQARSPEHRFGAPGAHFGAPEHHIGAPVHRVGAPVHRVDAPVHRFGAPVHRCTTPPPQPSPPPSEENKNIVFQHPFTMMISGPTACGKTTMVKELLQDHNSKIQPGIQRIVWLYKRWQPLYTLIQRSVLPRVEFIKGIPDDLEEDDFFDPRLNNLLILDDLFSEAGKDKRITDLFTEGSHHRSLSVISINQNLFGSKDPTQRRNCHYLVLFNNPIDKLSVMTLARQMYPGQTDIFMKMFAKATKHPYGHLLVDLKPFTPENKRLEYGINRFNFAKNDHICQKSDHVTSHKTIKEDVALDANHSAVGFQTGHIEEEPSLENMDKGQACDDCGQLFDTTHDVQRHVKNGWCPEHRESNKRSHEDMSDSEQEEDPVEDNDAYVQLWKKARINNEGKYEKIYNKFKDNGEDSDEAHEMTEERIQPYNEKGFFTVYTSLIDTYILPLRNSALYTQIMAQIDKLISKGHSTTSAVTKTLRKHNNYFQDLFDVEFSDDENSEEEESDSDVSEEETENV